MAHLPSEIVLAILPIALRKMLPARETGVRNAYRENLSPQATEQFFRSCYRTLKRPNSGKPPITQAWPCRSFIRVMALEAAQRRETKAA